MDEQADYGATEKEMRVEASAVTYDGQVKYTWPLLLIYQDQDLLVLRGEPNRPVCHYRHGVIHIETASLECYWRNAWYTVAISHDESGAVQSWYCNVCLPPLRWRSGFLSFVDLELDVLVRPDLSATIVDEEEFLAAVSRYQIPEHVVQQARRAVEDILDLVAAQSWPFSAMKVQELWPPLAPAWS